MSATSQREDVASGSGPDESIAVVGIGCRYADARGPEEFWDIAHSGRDTVREAPEHRVELGYDLDHFYDPRPRIPGKISSKKGGFLEHPELFDPAPFGIAPRDALTMEPQQRLMVEVTWDALEDAGIVPERIAGERVAVILGYMAEDYSRERAGVLGEEAVYRGHDVFTVGGMSHAVLSGRIAFLLGVTGPSFTLDTACSSSLIATHLACQSLRRGESNLALAGGVNLFLSPEGNIALSRSGMLSMSGACKAFDASADGFVRAEGAGVVVLERLSDARANGHPIYAVIRGSGISTDGRDGGHMMAPGRHGQAQAMRDAYAQAGVDPARIQYVETHGTGTMIGDPVEIGALADVMGPGRDPDRPLRVASVKGNLGHTESASGVAGLIKACLAIHHRELPAQVHFETPNPMIPWDEIPIVVQAETTSWPEPGPALVGVNSFGISGTNAHVVLESPPEEGDARGRAARPERRPLLLPISGHDPNALHDMVVSTRDQLAETPEDAAEDLVYTLGCRRSHRAHRLAVAADSPEALVEELDAWIAGAPGPALRTGSVAVDRRPKLVMVFPGQGGQWLGMGRSLLADEPVFAEAIDRIDAAYRAHVDWSLRDVLTGDAGIDWNARLDVLQPLLVAVEIALAELWQSFGLRPDRVIGQSMGEIAAAHVAGALDLESVARIACHRGRIVARATGKGAMAVVSLSRADVESRLETAGDGLEVAGVNSPRTTIVSGDRDAVVRFVEGLELEGVFARRLDVDFASHCFHMDPLLESFRKAIADVVPHATRLPFDSTVDGEEKEGEALGPDYWVRNLRAPVAFDRGLASALEAGGEVFLEVSPHPSLPRAIDEIAQQAGGKAAYVPSLVRGESESEMLARHLGALFVAGVPVDFEAYGPVGRVVRTPLYAYQRERYWFSDRSRLDHDRPTHPLLGKASDSSVDPTCRTWDLVYDADTAGFVDDRRLAGEPVAPAGLFLEIALAASEASWPGEPRTVADLSLRRPLGLGATERRALQVVLRRSTGELFVSSRAESDADWVLHVTATLVARSDLARPEASDALAPFSHAQTTAIPSERYDEALAGGDLRLGGRARSLRELAAEGRPEAPTAIIAKLMLPRSVEAEWHAYHAHPTLVEGALQAASQLFDPPRALEVVRIGSADFSAGLGSDCLCRVTLRDTGADDDGRVLDYAFFDREGSALGTLSGVQVRALPLVADRGASASRDRLELVWRAQADAAREEGAPLDRWIVVSDDEAEAMLLAAELRKRGAECRFCEKVEDLAGLAHLMNATDERPWGLLLLSWGRASREPALEPDTHRAFRIGSWAEAIRAHALDAEQVWVATRGLVPVTPGEEAVALAGRRVAQEIETFSNCLELERCRFFDASSALRPAERARLVASLGHRGPERRFAAREEALFVPRLVEGGEPGAASQKASRRPALERNFEAVHVHDARRVGRLTLRECAEPAPPPDSVVVEVEAVGLSQLDVLLDLGLALPEGGAATSYGSGFAGRVVAAGASVQGLRVGDAVFGLHPGSLARRIAVRRDAVVRRPEGLDATEAAGLPHAYLVAHHALEIVGRLRAGEALLVDAGAGAVGHALVRVGRALGADVSVLARRPERDASLAAAGATIVSAESGESAPSEAFDVIVGDGSGVRLEGLLGRLGAGGRYLDLCPRLSFARPALGSIRLGANRSFSSIESSRWGEEEPQLVGALLETIARAVEEDRGPSAPHTVFPVSEASRALRFMAQGRHVGQVCLDLRGADEVPIESTREAVDSLAGRGAFLVSGTHGAVHDAIVRALRAREVDAIWTPAEDEPIDSLVKRLEADASPVAGWIHLASESQPDRYATRDAVAQSGLPLRAFVALRPAPEGVPAIDCAWESRLWIDRLCTPSSDALVGWLDLSVGEGAPVEPLVRELEAFLSGSQTESGIVLMDESERHALDGSPLLEELARSGASATLGREELIALSPPERRLAIEGLVVAELAMVLGLDEEQRDALDPASRLDGLGLDSLMTLELFMGLTRALSLEIAQDWFDAIPTLSEIAATLADRIARDGGEAGS